MGNFRKSKKKQSVSDFDLVGTSNRDIVEDFRQAIKDAAIKSDTSLKNKKRNREDAIWLTDNLLTFEQFCSSADHMNFPPLSEKQKMVAEYMLGLEPKTVFQNERNTAILVWGKGSLLPTSEHITADGMRMTLKESAERNLPVKQWSRDPRTGRLVVVISTPAIKKQNQENCFRVKTSFGHISEASEDHQYLTVSGWMEEIKRIICGRLDLCSTKNSNYADL